MERKKSTAPKNGDSESSSDRPDNSSERPRNGGWQRIEALRERAALKASLADVWDDDFDLDEAILAELDHNAEFFTTEAEEDVEDIPDDENLDDFYDEDDDA